MGCFAYEVASCNVSLQTISYVGRGQNGGDRKGTKVTVIETDGGKGKDDTQKQSRQRNLS